MLLLDPSTPAGAAVNSVAEISPLSASEAVQASWRPGPLQASRSHLHPCRY